MTNTNDYNDNYKTANQLREGELNRLFQRVSFFLVGTAFLIAALVALINSDSFDSKFWLQIFAYLLTALGLGLSLLFTVSNYINDRVIRIISRLIIEIEADNSKHPHFLTTFYEQVKKEKFRPVQLVEKFLCDLWELIENPTNYNHPTEIIAPHTWLIPFGFILFWIAATGLVSFVKGYFLAGWIITGVFVCILFHIFILARIANHRSK